MLLRFQATWSGLFQSTSNDEALTGGESCFRVEYHRVCYFLRLTQPVHWYTVHETRELVTTRQQTGISYHCLHNRQLSQLEHGFGRSHLQVQHR